MKNLSNALVLSVAMLVAGSASAKNNQANLVATKLGISSEVFNQEAYFFGKNKKNYDNAVLASFIGKSTEAEKVKYLAALLKLQKDAQAELAAQGTTEAYESLVKINKLIARISKDCRFRNAYRALFYNGNVCKLEKREFRKIAAKAILKNNVTAAA